MADVGEHARAVAAATAAPERPALVPSILDLARRVTALENDNRFLLAAGRDQALLIVRLIKVVQHFALQQGEDANPVDSAAFEADWNELVRMFNMHAAWMKEQAEIRGAA